MLRQLCVSLARRAGSSAQQQVLPAACAALIPQAASAACAAAAPAERVMLLRAAAAFSTSGSALSESLQSLLKRELKHERTTYEAPEAVAKGPPAPFTLTSVPGDGTVTLKRDFNGEDISVDASLNMQVRPATGCWACCAVRSCGVQQGCPVGLGACSVKRLLVPQSFNGS